MQPKASIILVLPEARAANVIEVRFLTERSGCPASEIEHMMSRG